MATRQSEQPPLALAWAQDSRSKLWISHVIGKKYPMQMRVKKVRPPFSTHSVRSIPSREKSDAFEKQARLQKLLAMLMLVFVGALYAAPLVQAVSSDPESSLPACCRRHGNHHCAMMDQSTQELASGTRQVSQVPQHCPFYPHSSTAPVVRSHAGLAPSSAFFAQVLSQPAIQPQVRAVYRLSLDRSRQKRGPPSSLPCA